MELAQGGENVELMEALNDMQASDMSNMFNNLAATCFNRCVNNFRSRILDSKEQQCIETCATRFIKHYQRVGLRFADENARADTHTTTQS